MAISIAFRDPDDPEAKPQPLDSAVLHLPPGVRFDEAAAPICDASDEEVKLLGSEACPDETLLTIGSFSSMFGFGPPFDPRDADLHVFHGPSQLLEIITVRDGSASPAFDRITIEEGPKLVAHPPKAPGGPPDGRASVRTLAYEMPVVASGGHSFITTPPTCPESGVWTTTATFGFGDGSTDTVSTTTPCQAAAAAPAPAARPWLRLAVHPTRAKAGRRTRVRLRAMSSDPACNAGATIRVAGRKLRTGRDGRVVFRATFRKTGTRRAVSRTRGARRRRRASASCDDGPAVCQPAKDRAASGRPTRTRDRSTSSSIASARWIGAML